MENIVCRQRAVIDHDCSPSDQLQDIEHGKEKAAFLPEAHFNRLHGALSHTRADQPGKEHHTAADDMAGQDGCKPSLESERREVRSGQDLGDGYAGSEPDQAVFID